VKQIAVIIVMIGNLISMNDMHAKRPAKDLILPGPDGIQLRMSDGIVVPAFGGKERLYKVVEVIRPKNTPVKIDLDSDKWVDGDTAETNNLARKSVDGTINKDWSLSLWSCDGHYIVLSTVKQNEDGTWDFRNSSLDAYDTTTGEYADFRSPTSLIDNGTFVQWSPTKCDVAILRGDKGNEEARPQP